MFFENLAVDLDPAIGVSGMLARAAGAMIANPPSGNADVAEEKGDPDVGHHAIVTLTDITVQDFLMQSLGEAFAYARFITEERPTHPNPRIITLDTMDGMLDHPLIFGVDPKDGSSQDARGLWEVSVPIGVMRRGEHRGGAIFGPHVLGGFMVIGERGKGVFVSEYGRKFVPAHITPRPLKESMVLVGPDIFFLLKRGFGDVVDEISREVRTTSCTGSCALGLAAVAAGRVDLMIQPVQSPWDHFAGASLVEINGGRVIYFQYDIEEDEQRDGKTIEGKIHNIRPVDPRECWRDLYNPKNRKVAFLAGEPTIVAWGAGILFGTRA